ncbi:DUF4237 domain-containing protein [Pseudonocardiaceae bacterium YIM PH 21723]|nr:DUF4237 domain-containing protein [Pseudonocardiaceae bacterium YIM PH 21723]
MTTHTFHDHLRGAMLGGALGDAFGARLIDDEHPTELTAPGHGTAATQLACFTLEATIRVALTIGHYGHEDIDPYHHLRVAYLRWLHTQGVPVPGLETQQPTGWLAHAPEMSEVRVGEPTTSEALQSGEAGSFGKPINTYGDPGALLRSAPLAFWSPVISEVAYVAARAAALTHGHPDGHLPAAALAMIVQQAGLDQTLPEAVTAAITELSYWDGHQETVEELRTALELSLEPAAEHLVAKLGDAATATSCLGIAVYYALTAADVKSALRLAAAQSTATAGACGAILGALRGPKGLPADWLEALQLREVIEQLCADTPSEPSSDAPAEELTRRYGIRLPQEKSAKPAQAVPEVAAPEIPVTVDQEAVAAAKRDAEHRLRGIAARAGVSRRFLSLWTPAEHAWCLLDEDGQFQVFWQQDGVRSGVGRFTELTPAAVYLTAQLRENAHRLRRAPDEQLEDYEWPIQPLHTEPSLAHFTDKRLLKLAPGTELDHYGDYDRNVVYATGTPPEMRGGPQGVNGLPYRRLRLVGGQQLQVLHAVAKPAGNRPGGGWAYILPAPIGEMIRNRWLVELGDHDPSRAPIKPPLGIDQITTPE